MGGAVLDAIGEHLMKPESAGGFTGIDLSNMFWACGILGINPCGGALLPALTKHVIEKVGNMNQQVRSVATVPRLLFMVITVRVLHDVHESSLCKGYSQRHCGVIQVQD